MPKIFTKKDFDKLMDEKTIKRLIKREGWNRKSETQRGNLVPRDSHTWPGD